MEIEKKIGWRTFLIIDTSLGASSTIINIDYNPRSFGMLIGCLFVN